MEEITGIDDAEFEEQHLEIFRKKGAWDHKDMQILMKAFMLHYCPGDPYQYEKMQKCFPNERNVKAIQKKLENILKRN